MKFNVLALSALLFSNSLWADDALKQELAAAISNFLPDVEIDNIQPSPIEGLYQVIIGTEVIYMTRDGSYVVKGEILDINKRRNLTEDLRADSR
ncbi:MAG: disulfide isomerase DsbC N-terminal domain-containing protein, partial [Gammaproteobacteria bacterium]